MKRKMLNTFAADLLSRRDKLTSAASRCAEEFEIERVHALRIACRRMQAHLRLVNAVMKDRRAKKVTRKLQRLLRRLGRIRDLQVQQRRLRAYEMERNPVVTRYLTVLQEREARALARARALLKGNAAAHLESLTTALADRLRDMAAAGARRAILDALRSFGRRYRRRMQNLDPNDPAGMHRARVSLKRYRYALEACRSLMKEPLDQPLTALRDAQRELGEVHDNEVLLRDFERFSKNKRQHTRALRCKMRRTYRNAFGSALQHCEEWGALGRWRNLW